jgi:hypothetical protein
MVAISHSIARAENAENTIELHHANYRENIKIIGKFRNSWYSRGDDEQLYVLLQSFSTF